MTNKEAVARQSRRKNSRIFQLLSTLALTAVTVIGAGLSSANDTQREQPNIVVFLIDELRVDEIDRQTRQSFVRAPNIDRLADQGVSFSNFYAVSTICSPNRASLLTGQYPPVHGVVDNTDRSRLSHQLPTFASALHDNGYETAFVGKWHMGNDPTPRPGFDYWAAIPGQGRMWNPELWKDNKRQTVNGYVTDVLTDEAVSFLRKPRSKPFLLYLSHKAIHPDVHQNSDSSVDLSSGIRYEAAKRHQGAYQDESIAWPLHVRFAKKSLTGKPVLARALARKHNAENSQQWGSILSLDGQAQTLRDRAEMLLSIDESVGRVVSELRQQGALDNTLIIFTSDNGTNLGDHGLTLERRLPYETVINLPFILYYPPWQTQAEKANNALTLQVDIAPTILEAAGLMPLSSMQGQSFKSLLTQPKTPWRDSFLIEHRPDERPFLWLKDMSFLAVRWKDLKYIHWIQYPEEPELYDLAEDPLEMHNLIDSEKHQWALPVLQKELKKLLLESRRL